jgi:glycosyltransferase involved in cell wall biosynthesis
MNKDLITVCICTYQRVHLLQRLFEKLSLEKGHRDFEFDIVVVDNDSAGSARAVVSNLESRFDLRVAYDVVPNRNFALVRNRAVELAKGEFIAFIDDDEVPVDSWLYRLRATLDQFGADGVLGPVKPYFEQTPPAWLIKSGLCERQSHPTGMMLNWRQTRTGNTMLRKTIFCKQGVWFDPSYATGGEDKDFFKRAMAAGCKFFWCEEAAVYELVPPDRQRRSYFLKRALLQGAISLKYDMESSSARDVLLLRLKTIAAAIAYTALLPVFLCGGMHVFIKYLVKDCHHISRLSAMLGLPIMSHRNF